MVTRLVIWIVLFGAALLVFSRINLLAVRYSFDRNLKHLRQVFNSNNNLFPQLFQ
jgi:4-amino-4-deoxy-L-arabinose transferase-like glycosyltransferase